MNAVITKKQKNKIMILGGITAVFGATAASIGLNLRIELTTTQSWHAEGMSQFTNGYFGVMSGFALFLLGTAGYGLVYSRISCLVFLYWLLSLTCDVLCILDVVMVMPYTKNNGKFAWQECNTTTFHNTTNIQDINTDSCEDIKTIAILFICIPTALLIALLFAVVTTTVAAVALCYARTVSAPDKPDIQLAPFSTPKHFQPTSYNNTVWQSDGFRS